MAICIHGIKEAIEVSPQCFTISEVRRLQSQGGYWYLAVERGTYANHAGDSGLKAIGRWFIEHLIPIYCPAIYMECLDSVWGPQEGEWFAQNSRFVDGSLGLILVRPIWRGGIGGFEREVGWFLGTDKPILEMDWEKQKDVHK